VKGEVIMFDNLRDQANSTPFYEDEAQFREAEGLSVPARKAPRGRFLGMTPPQRFIVAIMFLISICVLGAMLLLVTGRVSIF
jgi:hypothetical protein